VAGNILECFSSVSQENVNLISSQIVKEIFRFKYFNSIKARDKLGWSPQQSLENAVRQAIEYYEENQLLK
jgi:nucleoside-diphosphate-sugar epimerase